MFRTSTPLSTDRGLPWCDFRAARLQAATFERWPFVRVASASCGPPTESLPELPRIDAGELSKTSTTAIMATTRLRKAFRYPDDSDEEPPEGIDEEGPLSPSLPLAALRRCACPADVCLQSKRSSSLRSTKRMWPKRTSTRYLAPRSVISKHGTMGTSTAQKRKECDKPLTPRHRNRKPSSPSPRSLSPSTSGPSSLLRPFRNS